ncbi:unnamed protein product [Bursaphelenchus xylophilus]|uniref:(pine wood nematode) hypothetical protein n=1 Tax=Bursaphelenchus xylophilus TaxID=6326 RepID=A0A1I7SEQ8_BURXY|nr:unnamed protein product [Bursaphelenchus xylophilus]CAG9128261.1 unnamed protein product [Bursaphelenchus xylophilus]
MKGLLILLILLFSEAFSYHFRRLYPELTTLLQSDVSGNGDGLSRAQRKLLLVLVNNDEGEESRYYEAIRDHKVAKRFEDVFETALGDSDLDENMKKYLLEIQKSLHQLYSVSRHPTNIDRQLVHTCLAKIWDKYDHLSSNQKALIRKKAPEFLQLNTDGDSWLSRRSPAQIYDEAHKFNNANALFLGNFGAFILLILSMG